MPESYPVPYSTVEVPPDPNADDVVADSIRESSGPTALAVGAVADGEYLKRDGSTVVGDTPGGGGVTLETPTPDPDDVEDTFTGSAPPKMVFRNGVMELRLGTVAGNTFVFDTPPSTGDDIEFVV